MDPWPATERLGCSLYQSLSQRGPEHLAAYTHVGCEAAFRRSIPLDRIAPAPLNIATALHAETTRAVSLSSEGVGMERIALSYSRDVQRLECAGGGGKLSPSLAGELCGIWLGRRGHSRACPENLGSGSEGINDECR